METTRPRHTSGGSGISCVTGLPRSKHHSGSSTLRKCPLSCRDLRKCCASSAPEEITTDVVIIGEFKTVLRYQLSVTAISDYLTAVMIG